MKIKKKIYKKIINWFTYLCLLLLVFVLGMNTNKKYPAATDLASPFIYSFNVNEVLAESGNMRESPSPYWWLNSGGIMKIEDLRGSTNIGELDSLSKWRLLYKISNPEDTDDGYHPQNIFRLVSRNTWQDFSTQSYFKILKDNLSESSNRNASNGILLMLRYQDGDNLYYAGLRVDGTAIIKKKIDGEYFTLAQKQIFDGFYDREKNPNLLPKNVWLGVRGEIKNQNGFVAIKLFVDTKEDGKWVEILEARDMDSSPNKEPIYDSGFSGIRTDFMDVEFKDFRITKI